MPAPNFSPISVKLPQSVTTAIASRTASPAISEVLFGSSFPISSGRDAQFEGRSPNSARTFANASASSFAVTEDSPSAATLSAPPSFPVRKGAPTNSCDLPSTVTVRSNIAAAVAESPAQTPPMTAICGITPDARLTSANSIP